MGGGRQKRAAERTAGVQERMSNTQEQWAKYMMDLSREDREFMQEIYGKIAPFAENLIGTFDSEKYGDMERPDVTGQINRDYFDELSNIENLKNRSIADSEDYATSSGMARTGMRGMGLGSIARGANFDRGDARRRMQQRTTDESLAGYYDTRDRRNEEAQLAVAGTNILAGQQGQFNPQGYASMAQGGMSAAGQGQAGAGKTYGMASQMPSRWSTIGGIAGGVLGNALLPGSGGLSSIWRGGR